MTTTPTPATVAADENHLIAERRSKLARLRSEGVAYPNDFVPKDRAADLHTACEELDKAALEELAKPATVAGRMMLKRVMGKASFATLQDATGRIQIYLDKNGVAEDVYENFKTWDIGDIIGVEGVMFKTNKGELSVRASEIRLLSKSLRPLPDKFHGVTDQELRYRQRYVDLVMNEETRHTFVARSKAIARMRQFMVDEGFMEVETPMLHPIPGGAAAKPFITHHNALDMEMFLRIAPELYLKRLIVGGFERVFELNRNFRNEGVSPRHNPEFT
ncbi:MAG: amino acid--tRNA ligase-related protein, partial [Pusillimonas sp.]